MDIHMEADDSRYYTEADEARPAKRVKLDGALDATEEVQDEIVDDEDWGDIYGTSEAERVDVKDGAEMGGEDGRDEVLGADAPQEGTLPVVSEVEHAQQAEPPSAPVEAEDGVPADAIEGDDALVDEHSHGLAVEQPAVRIPEEVSAINGDPDAEIDATDGVAGGDVSQTQMEEKRLPKKLEEPAEDNALDAPQQEAAAEAGAVSEPQPPAEHEIPTAINGVPANTDDTPDLEALLNGITPQPPTQATDDPDFMAAAAAQKSNPASEWQFDSSDADEDDSDSDTSSSGSSSSSSDEEGYEMLDPATAARILMQGDGDDGDDGDGKNKKNGAAGGDNQPRTTNEVKETVVPKPDIPITPSTKITELGGVERSVGSMLLIKGATPGEYQVLESGSVLCNAARQIIGVVGETLGRVQQPFYSVAFTNAQEIADLGLDQPASKVYYVDGHSAFVFTQPLKGLRGTDASNIHDEEVGEEEAEFSDDEAEAEYKRAKKLAKRGGMAANGRGGRGGYDASRTFGAPGHDSGSTFIPGSGNDAPRPQQVYGGALSYDDGDEAEAAEEFYSPLKRPENLSQMMAGSSPPPPRPQGSQGGFERGRGRGRGDRGRGRGEWGRGRGDRGRGRGGFEGGRGQGQRGGSGVDRGGQGPRGGGRGGGFNEDRNNARGGGDRGGYANGSGGGGHRGNAQSFPDRHNSERAPQPLPQKPAAPTPQQQGSPQQQHAGAYNGYVPPAPQQSSPQPQSSYQFGGYTFQYGTGNPGPAPAAPTPYPPAQQGQRPNGYAYQQAYPQQSPQAYQQQQPYHQAQQAYQHPHTQTQPHLPQASPEPGAYLNPAFFPQNSATPHQQQQQQHGQQGQQQYGAWQTNSHAAAPHHQQQGGQQAGQQYGHPGQQHQHQRGQQQQGQQQQYGAAGWNQEKGMVPQQQAADLAELLRRIGGGQS
ncbi:hypothetical protein LTR53_014708 [Teratosphaeriaceae sp. CCFEE 6253]|nr:hypothetical protein LTR53_014708 [Teratosphaeriaceae sp. CCFEE 6253]